MKNTFKLILMTIVLVIFSQNVSQAQNNNVSTTVNIILNDVISIDDESVANGGMVDFNYVTAEDYNSDKTVIVPNSLIITSTNNFDVKVKADGTSFSDGNNNIPVNVLEISVSTGGNTNGSSGNMPVVTLSNSDQLLIGNASKGSKQTFDLSYKIPKEKSSSSEILGKPAGTYTQTVTYTATAL